VILADQFTKTLILGYYQLGDSTTITSFFNIVRAHNTGAAFSFLAGAGGWQRWFFTGWRGRHGVHRLACCARTRAEAVLLRAVDDPGRRRGQRGGPADARLCGGLPHAGAAACPDADVLLFLHADTRLPDDADTLVLAALSEGAAWGRFDVRIDGRSRWLPWWPR
jgi:hypothetical protein